MQRTESSQKIDESYVRRKLAKLDSQGKIDLSKIHNSLHLKRIIENLINESDSFSLKEVFDPKMIQIAINSRHYNYLRPEGALKYDALTFDFKTVTAEERYKLLELPLDELRDRISNYLKIAYPLPFMTKIQIYKLADFFTCSFADTIYCEALWDNSLVMSIVSIVTGIRYESLEKNKK